MKGYPNLLFLNCVHVHVSIIKFNYLITEAMKNKINYNTVDSNKQRIKTKTTIIPKNEK